MKTYTVNISVVTIYGNRIETIKIHAENKIQVRTFVKQIMNADRNIRSYKILKVKNDE